MNRVRASLLNIVLDETLRIDKTRKIMLLMIRISRKMAQHRQVGIHYIRFV